MLRQQGLIVRPGFGVSGYNLLSASASSRQILRLQPRAAVPRGAQQTAMTHRKEDIVSVIPEVCVGWCSTALSAHACRMVAPAVHAQGSPLLPISTFVGIEVRAQLTCGRTDRICGPDEVIWLSTQRACSLQGRKNRIWSFHSRLTRSSSL